MYFTKGHVFSILFKKKLGRHMQKHHLTISVNIPSHLLIVLLSLSFLIIMNLKYSINLNGLWGSHVLSSYNRTL